jgi:hypothetical protein
MSGRRRNGWGAQTNTPCVDRCRLKDDEVWKDMEKLERFYPELATGILEEIREICGLLEGDGCVLYEEEIEDETLNSLMEYVMRSMTQREFTGNEWEIKAGNTEKIGNAEWTGNAAETGNAEWTGNAEEIGNAEWTGGAAETGNAEWTGSAKEAETAEGTESAEEPENAEEETENESAAPEECWRNLVEVLVCQEVLRRRMRKRSDRQRSERKSKK